MPAYFVIDLDVRDPAGFQAYVRRVGPVLEQYGGRYLVAGEGIEVVEGDWKPKRMTIIEFPSKARAKEFYGSKEFQAVVGLRHKSAKTNLVLVDGWVG